MGVGGVKDTTEVVDIVRRRMSDIDVLLLMLVLLDVPVIGVIDVVVFSLFLLTEEIIGALLYFDDTYCCVIRWCDDILRILHCFSVEGAFILLVGIVVAVALAGE